MKITVDAFEVDSETDTFEVEIDTDDILNVDVTENGFVIDLKKGNKSGWECLWCSDQRGLI
jgi:hypothetical protein